MSDALLVPAVDLGGEIDTWFADLAATSPRIPIRWMHRWYRSDAVSVRGVEHLTVLVSMLKLDDFGGLEPSIGGTRWGQTLRSPHGWIVEVRDCTNSDYPQRVFRGEPHDYDSVAEPSDHTSTEMWTPAGAAQILWAWTRGTLLEGCSLQPIE